MKGGYIHVHKRHRSQGVQNSPKVKMLDKVVFYIAIIFPFTTLPQLYEVWFMHSVQGVSILTWSLYLFLTVPLIVYGLVHKQKPIVIMYSLWIVVHSFMITGILLRM